MMTERTPTFNNDDLIPAVEANTFNDRPDKRFAVGIVSEGLKPLQDRESIFKGALRLRANVYIDKMGFMADDKRRPDGTEMDIDDERSIHIVAVENKMGRVAVVGSMRLIEKSEENSRLLPIEEFFGDEFEDAPAELGSLEVSRLTAQHEDRYHRDNIRTRMFAKGVAHVLANKMGATYAVIEQHFDDHLERLQVPRDVVAPLRWVPKYRTENLGVKIDTPELGRRLGPDMIQASQDSMHDFEYWGKVES